MLVTTSQTTAKNHQDDYVQVTHLAKKSSNRLSYLGFIYYHHILPEIEFEMYKHESNMLTNTKSSDLKI